MLLLLLPLALADLPVHCMRAQILGEWTLSIGPSSPERSPCGHQRPDSPTSQPVRVAPKDSTEFNVVFADKGANKVAVQYKGKESYFSMVYDEGFELELEDKALFAFSAYDLKPSLTGGKAVNVSKCEETEVGWYTTKDRSAFGCWIGHKVEKAQVLAKTDAEVRPVPVEKKADESFHKKLNVSEHEAKVAAINAKATTWKAKAFLQYDGKSMADLSRKAGHRRASPTGVEPERMAFLAKATHLVRRESEAVAHNERLVATLPKEFDWRHPPKGADHKEAEGESILEPVMDQADCGSCYAVATMRMLSARHRKNTGSKVPFSISFPLYCSEFNQGCEGGFSNLVSRWSQDVGLVPATCATYNTHASCNYDCQDTTGPSSGFRADKHRYVGGYYGKANAGEMMQELIDNGPMAVGVRVADNFMYYTEGIYQGELLPQIEKTDGWQEMQHAVLLVGYGEENGLKYWTIQNSWDEYWGEDGYMRIRRGENDSGMESSPEAADVVPDESKGARVKYLLTDVKKKAR